MTDLTLPAEIDGEIDNLAAAHSWEQAGTGAWIVNGSDLGEAFPSIDETALNAFAPLTSGLTVTFDGGEFFGIGGWGARDTTTDVSLPDESTTTVYLGIDISAGLASGDAPADNANIIIGPAGDFADPDPRAPIWTFTTSGGVVVDSEDHRVLRKPFEWDPINHQATVSGGVTAEGGVISQDRTTIEHVLTSEDGRIPLEFNDPDGGNSFIHGLINHAATGVSRGVGVSSGRTGSISAWFDGGDGSAGFTGPLDSTVSGTIANWRTDDSPNHIRHEWSSDGLRYVYTPVYSGTSETTQQLRYNFETDRWEFRGDVQLGRGLLSGDGVRFRDTGTKYPIVFDRESSGAFLIAGLVDYSNSEYARSLAWFAGENDDTPNAEVSQSGDAYFGSVDARGQLTEQGSPAVTGDQDYEIQKNGTDGAGIINFKTQ